MPIQEKNAFNVNFLSIQCIYMKRILSNGIFPTARENQFFSVLTREKHAHGRKLPVFVRQLAAHRLQLLQFPDETRVGSLDALDVANDRLSFGEQSGNRE